jgi:predicted protein tyrosine phosphatase
MSRRIDAGILERTRERVALPLDARSRDVADIGREPIADHLTQRASAAAAQVLVALEDDHRRALPQHETAAILRKRLARS